MGSRGDVIANAYRRYHAGEITLAELQRTVRQWRPTTPKMGKPMLDITGQPDVPSS